MVEQPILLVAILLAAWLASVLESELGLFSGLLSIVLRERSPVVVLVVLVVLPLLLVRWATEMSQCYSLAQCLYSCSRLEKYNRL